MMTLAKPTAATLALLAALLATPASHAAAAQRVLGNWQHFGDVVSNEDSVMLSTATTVYEDDAPLPAGYFNLSGQDAGEVGAAQGLESFVGVPIGALDPDPVDHTVALYEGSAARLTLEVQAGDTLSFQWNLLTADTWMADPAMLLIGYGTGQDAQWTVLGDATQALQPGAAADLLQTGYRNHTHTFTRSGTVTLAFAVADAGDYNGTTQLSIQGVQVTAVPEPQALSLVLGGLALLAWRRKRLPL